MNTTFKIILLILLSILIVVQIFMTKAVFDVVDQLTNISQTLPYIGPIKMLKDDIAILIVRVFG